MSDQGPQIYARASARKLGRDGAVIKLLHETKVTAKTTSERLRGGELDAAAVAAERTTALLISLQRSLDFRTKAVRRTSQTLAIFYQGLKFQIESAVRDKRPDLADFVVTELDATLRLAAGVGMIRRI